VNDKGTSPTNQLQTLDTENSIYCPVDAFSFMNVETTVSFNGQSYIPNSVTETSFVSEDTCTGQSYIPQSVTETSFVSGDTCN
jgi:hypothetical protein